MFKLLFFLFAHFLTSVNISADLLGPVDTRPGTWGRAESVIIPIRFNSTVTIYRVRGDLIGGIRKPTDALAWALTGLRTNEPNWSVNIHPDVVPNDNCFLFYQMPIQRTNRIAFNDEMQKYIADGVINLTIASFLNETEQPVHLETTLVLEYSVGY